jgi:excisionase family DNA binding protein
MELNSAADAAEALGVSERQVRRLAAAGELLAHRVGDRWLIDADAIRSRSRSVPQSGRPLSPAMAWLLLRLLQSGAGQDDSPEKFLDSLDRRVRHRLRSLLAGAPPAERWDQWLRHRAKKQRVWVHPGILRRLEGDDRLHVSGARALAAAGVGIAEDGRQRHYIQAGDVAALVAEYHARPSNDGQVELMIVPDGVPHVLGGPGAPVHPVLAFVDLLGSSDARARHAAVSALDAARQRLVPAAADRV